MTTKIINGNIIDSKAQIIAHQVNCKFVMGAGVAKAIRNAWPAVYDKYRSLNKSDKYDIKLNNSSRYIGKCQIVFLELMGQEFRYVANLFGQDDYGNDGKQYTDYTALECALYSLKRFALYENMNTKNKTIAFPYGIGCGLAGGDWDIVSKMIEKVFADTDIDIEYWKLK